METKNKTEREAKHVILHMGTPKTGSSAIQRFLTKNKDVLEKRGIGYYIPSCRYHPWNGDQNADFLIYEVLKKIGVDAPVQNEVSLKKEYETFKEYCMSYNTLILSDEDLWDRAADHKSFLPVLKDRIIELCGTDSKIDIVVYLRRQDEWLLSRWKEDIRSIDEIMDDFPEAVQRYRDLGYLDYYKLLDNVSELFGEERIVVRPYEKNRLKGGSAVWDFIDVSGIEDQDGLEFSKEIINKGFSMNSTEALRLIKLGKVPYDGPWDAIMFAIWKISESGELMMDDSFPMSYRDRESLVREFAESNRKIGERFFDGMELFSEDSEEYLVWESDYERDLKNAKALVELARIKNERNMQRQE